MRISLEKAILIAKEKAISLNYDLNKMRMVASDDNRFWNNYASDGVLADNPIIKQKLNKREFWAIYFAPTEFVLGGDLFVFVDKKSGEIFFVLQGK